MASYIPIPHVTMPNVKEYTITRGGTLTISAPGGSCFHVYGFGLNIGSTHNLIALHCYGRANGQVQLLELGADASAHSTIGVDLTTNNVLVLTNNSTTTIIFEVVDFGDKLTIVTS